MPTEKKKAPAKKAAPKKRKSAPKKENEEVVEKPEPKEEPKTSSSAPRKKHHGGGGFGIFVFLLFIVLGGFIIFQQLTTQDVRQTLESKISSLEKETSHILSTQSELKKEKTELEEKVKENETDLEKANALLREADIKDDRENIDEVDEEAICTNEPVELINGELSYPVHPKYTGLSKIGQLFTAADCNDEIRITEVFENTGSIESLNFYELTFFSDTFADEEQQELLSNAGFICATSIGDKDTCDMWHLIKAGEIDLEALLELRDIVDIIKEG